MSRPKRLTLPDNAASYELTTARGAFAALEARPAGRPAGTALLVPGFTGSKEDFLDLLAPLAAAGFRVVAIDGRGQHETPGPPDEAAYAQKELAADVRAVAAAIGATPEHPVHLLGHSLGGHIVRAAVLEEPGGGPWASLTLMSSGPAAISAEQQVRTQLAIDFLPTTDMETAWRMLRSMDGEAGEAGGAGDAGDAGPDEPAGLQEFLHRRWVTTVPEQLIATARQLMTEPDRVGELAAVPLPKLVLSGQVDYAWPVPELDEMAVRLGARRVVIEGAEHSPNAERPAQTAAALAAFWTDAHRGAAPGADRDTAGDPRAAGDVTGK
jgi:pimeloyl-ACP methyl ester carboxylesterase